MRTLKIALAVVGALMAFGAIAAVASAALPEFLPGSGTFTATSGEGELSAALPIICKKDKATGTITGAKTATTSVDFEGCKILGQPANSLGDKSETILVGLAGTLCYISKSAKEVGVLFTINSPGVHIEIPSLKELLVVSGSVVLKATPVNTSSTTGTLEVNKSNFKCEGETDKLKVVRNESGEEEGKEKTTEAVTFAAATELMA